MSSIINKVFQGYLTYRQRYILWVVLFFLCAPIPAYWTLQTDLYFIRREDLHLLGTKTSAPWVSLLTALAQEHVEAAALVENTRGVSQEVFDDTAKAFGASLADVEEEARQAPDKMEGMQWVTEEETIGVRAYDKLSTIKAQWKGIKNSGKLREHALLNRAYGQLEEDTLESLWKSVYEYQIVLGTDDAVQQLVESTYFSLPSMMLTTAHLHAMLFDYLGDKQPSQAKAAKVTILLQEFQKYLQVVSAHVEGPYDRMEMNSWLDVSIVAEAQGRALALEQMGLQYVSFVEGVIAKNHAHPEEITKMTLALLDAIEAAHHTAVSTLQEVFVHKRGIYMLFLQAFIAFLVAVSVFFLFFLALRGLSVHFLVMLDYVRGVTRGQYSIDYPMHPHEEIGKITTTLHNLGQSIGGVVTTLRTLGGNLRDRVKKITVTADAQLAVLAVQEGSLSKLKDHIGFIKIQSQLLQGMIGAFMTQLQERGKEDAAKNRLVPMQGKIITLASSTKEILENLDRVQNTVVATQSVTTFMSKVSDQASLLSLNAAIEALEVQSTRHAFAGITEKIQNFSNLTAASAGSIQEMISAISQQVLFGKDRIALSLKEVSAGAYRLVSLGRQLHGMTQQEDRQTETFQDVFSMMHDQAAITDEVMKSLESLDLIVGANRTAVKDVYKILEDLKRTSIDFERISQSIFRQKAAEGGAHG